MFCTQHAGWVAKHIPNHDFGANLKKERCYNLLIHWPLGSSSSLSVMRRQCISAISLMVAGTLSSRSGKCQGLAGCALLAGPWVVQCVHQQQYMYVRVKTSRKLLIVHSQRPSLECTLPGVYTLCTLRSSGNACAWSAQQVCAGRYGIRYQVGRGVCQPHPRAAHRSSRPCPQYLACQFTFQTQLRSRSYACVCCSDHVSSI